MVTYEVLHTESHVPVFNDVFDTLEDAATYAVKFGLEYPGYLPIEIREVRHKYDCDKDPNNCKCPSSRYWLIRISRGG